MNVNDACIPMNRNDAYVYMCMCVYHNIHVYKRLSVYTRIIYYIYMYTCVSVIYTHAYMCVYPNTNV